jgi:uncharacterized protein (TIGR00290 family)
MKKVALSFSSGKDSSYAAYVLSGMEDVELGCVFSTYTESSNRIGMHETSVELVQAQADAMGLPLIMVGIPPGCLNGTHQQRMLELCNTLTEQGYTHVAFGDLFLQDIRDFREEKMALTKLGVMFPVWDPDSAATSKKIIAAGIKSVITSVHHLSTDYIGKIYDQDFVDSLPEGCDPCGENGEFHSFCFDSPMFDKPIGYVLEDIVNVEGEYYAYSVIKKA